MGLVNNTLGTVGVVFGLAVAGTGLVRTVNDPNPDNASFLVRLGGHTFDAAADLTVGVVSAAGQKLEDLTAPDNVP